MEETFAKIQNQYLNVNNIERVAAEPETVKFFTSTNSECVMPQGIDTDDDLFMTKVARKVNETSHDIIYLESIVQNDEEIFDEDKSSNLLYRRWLERQQANDVVATAKIKAAQ